MLGLSDFTRTSRVRSLTARELPLAVEGYLVYCRSIVILQEWRVEVFIGTIVSDLVLMVYFEYES